MSDNLRTYTKSLFILDAVAQRVPVRAWDDPTACEGWSARQVAGHAAWLIKNLGSIASGSGSIDGQAEELVLGNSPAEGMRQIVDRTLEQLDEVDGLARSLPTPWGTQTVDEFIGEVWLDPVIHAWDLADATGVAHGIDELTAEAALQQVEAMSPGHRESWEFDAARPSSDGAAIRRLIALTGRAPSS